MKKLSQLLAVAGIASALLLSTGSVVAQDNNGGGGGGGRRGGGNFDPEQMRQRMMDNIREQFGVKDDAEWKLIETRVGKVFDARREVGFGGGGGMGRLFRPPGGGGGGDNGGGQGRQRRFGGEPSAEDQALEKAIESKASKDELKAAMAKVREAKKAKEEKLATAQEELKKVLNTQQEAIALSMGLVK